MEYSGWAWLFVVVCCIIIEASTVSLTTIWFAAGALFAWLIHIIGLGIEIQVFVFLLVSIISLVYTRPIFVEKLKIGKYKTNTDLLIGQQFKVETTIDNINNDGEVNVRGQIWSARSVDGEVIEKGELVVVKEIIGVRLIVEKINRR